MKHNLKIVLILVSLFLAAQYIGLYINHQYFTQELPFNIQRPEFDAQISFIPTIMLIIFMTIIILLLAKFKLRKLWKAWFFFAVWFALVISLSVFVNQRIAIIIGLFGAIFKVLDVDIYVHNITELFIYGGLVAIFAPTSSNDIPSCEAIPITLPNTGASADASKLPSLTVPMRFENAHMLFF